MEQTQTTVANAPEAKPQKEKLPVGKFFAWKSRDISLASLQFILMTYLMLYCTNILQMNPTLVGALLMGSKIFDGITDIFAGYLVDNTKTRWGKARPYELCIVGCWGFTMLLFSCPPGWDMALKSAWLVVMYVFVQSVFNTLLLANQAPYIIRAFKTRSMVTKVSSYGGVVSTLGAMVVSITFPILMGSFATSSGGWRSLIAIYAVPLALIGLLRFFFVKEDASIDADSAGQKLNLREVGLMFRKNKYIWIFAGITALFQLIQGMNVSAYYFTYVVGDITKQGILNMLTIIMLPVMFIFPLLMKKISVSNLIQAAAALSVVGYGINFFAGANMVLLTIGNILAALATLPISYLSYVIIMQLITYNQWHGLPRMDATTATVNNFTSKVFQGVGSGLAGVLLGAAGYISAENAAQPDSAVFMIRSMYSIIPLVCMVGIIIFATLLGRLEKDIPRYEVELEERKAAAEAAAGETPQNAPVQ